MRNGGNGALDHGTRKEEKREGLVLGFLTLTHPLHLLQLLLPGVQLPSDGGRLLVGRLQLANKKYGVSRKKRRRATLKTKTSTGVLIWLGESTRNIEEKRRNPRPVLNH